MEGRISLGVGGVVAVLLELDAQPPLFLQKAGEPPQFPSPFRFVPHLFGPMQPEVMNQGGRWARAAIGAEQHLPTLIELVVLRLDLLQESFQFLAG
jgi:hypothetical protein